MIAILQPVADLVQTRHYTVLVVTDRSNNHAEGRLAVGVHD